MGSREAGAALPSTGLGQGRSVARSGRAGGMSREVGAGCRVPFTLPPAGEGALEVCTNRPMAYAARRISAGGCGCTARSSGGDAISSPPGAFPVLDVRGGRTSWPRWKTVHHDRAPPPPPRLVPPSRGFTQETSGFGYPDDGARREAGDRPAPVWIGRPARRPGPAPQVCAVLPPEVP